MADLYNREDYELMCDQRRRAFKRIAEALGKEHQITQLMGSLAWGRNDFEPKPGRTAVNAHEEYGYLEGCFNILGIWARDHDVLAQNKMLRLWPTHRAKVARD